MEDIDEGYNQRLINKSSKDVYLIEDQYDQGFELNQYVLALCNNTTTYYLATVAQAVINTNQIKIRWKDNGMTVIQHLYATFCDHKIPTVILRNCIHNSELQKKASKYRHKNSLLRKFPYYDNFQNISQRNTDQFKEDNNNNCSNDDDIIMTCTQQMDTADCNDVIIQNDYDDEETQITQTQLMLSPEEILNNDNYDIIIDIKNLLKSSIKNEIIHQRDMKNAIRIQEECTKLYQQEHTKRVQDKFMHKKFINQLQNQIQVLQNSLTCNKNNNNKWKELYEKEQIKCIQYQKENEILRIKLQKYIIYN